MRTIVGLGDAKAVKRYSAFLAVDVGRESYFNRKFMGEGVEAQTPIQILPQLENDAGDNITYDLVMQLRMKPVEGDSALAGKEEDLKFYSDNLFINQMRGGVNTGGKMSRKRTIHNMRQIARVRQSEWWARLMDEVIFMYLSGGRGTNDDYILETSYPGFANNPFVAPDDRHLMFGSGATSKATITNASKFDLSLIERASTRAKTMGGGTQKVPKIEPIRIKGEEHYVIVMHPFQEHDLRTNTSTGQWIDIQKAAAGAEGRDNPIFKGGLGMYNKVVLHSHQSVTTYSDFGSGANLPAARALFMGRQAGVVAFGSPGTGMRFDWHEEAVDRGNQVVIDTSCIFGVKKTAFTIDGVSRDFGVVSLDTYAADPQ